MPYAVFGEVLPRKNATGDLDWCCVMIRYYTSVPTYTPLFLHWHVEIYILKGNSNKLSIVCVLFFSGCVVQIVLHLTLEPQSIVLKQWRPLLVLLFHWEMRLISFILDKKRANLINENGCPVGRQFFKRCCGF